MRDNSSDTHLQPVLPLPSFPPHATSPDCWCEPTPAALEGLSLVPFDPDSHSYAVWVHSPSPFQLLGSAFLGDLRFS